MSILALGVTLAMALQFDPDAGKCSSSRGPRVDPAVRRELCRRSRRHRARAHRPGHRADPVCILASWHDVDDSAKSVKGYFALLLLLETFMIGVFAALTSSCSTSSSRRCSSRCTSSSGRYGGTQRSYAAVKFLLYSLFGGLLMLAAVIGLFVVSRRRPRLPVPEPPGHRHRAEHREAALRRLLHSPSRSRLRCGRSTPGCRMPRQRPRPAAPYSSWVCSTRSARSACCGSACPCSRTRRGGPRRWSSRSA